MSERIIRGRQQVPGGYLIEVEVTEAYTDGRSRFDTVFVEAEKLRGTRTAAQRLQAVWDAVEDAQLDELTGNAVAAPAVDRDILEDRMVELYERWQRWKATRAEAQARGMASAVVTALTARENAAWAAYGDAIAAWRNA